MSNASRRDFLVNTLASVAAGGMYFGAPATRTALADFKNANDQPIVGFIGTGIRFHTALGKGATEFGPCAAVCDLDAIQLGRAKQVVFDQHIKHDRPLTIDTHDDYRHVLDNKDVDAVLIATPDHWHTKIAIEAMQAGKDVYCEKPVTLTIREGQQILKVMNQTNRVIQVGTQQRTEYGHMFVKAVAMVRDGRVGTPKKVTCAIGGSRDSGPLPVVDAPKTLDWDRWLGQAPETDYRAGEIVDKQGWGAGFPFGRAHRYYRWWYEYSGGKLTDWGAHHVDIALWAIDKLGPNVGKIEIEPLMVKHPVAFKDGMPMQDDRFNCATEFKVRVGFADGVEMIVRHSAVDDLGFENGIMFEGSAGRFLVNRGKLVGKPVEQLKEKPLAENAIAELHGGQSPDSHMANFMECIKTRATPISDMQSHHRMLAICHGINIAMRLDRKITYDPKTETFDDQTANSFVERAQRKGYEIRI